MVLAAFGAGWPGRLCAADDDVATSCEGGRPSVICVTGGVARGSCAVAEVRWNARIRELSGSVEVVANEICVLLIRAGDGASAGAVVSASVTGGNGYELAIAPGEGVAARPDDAYSNANTPEQPMTYIHEPKTDNGIVRVVFSCGTAGPVTWRVRFAERVAAPCGAMRIDIEKALPSALRAMAGANDAALAASACERAM